MVVAITALAGHVAPAGAEPGSAQSVERRAPGSAVDHDLDGDGLADVLWYGSGPAGDHLWTSRGDGAFASRPLSVDGTFQTLAGDFDGSGSTDVFWYSPGPEPDVLERFDGSAPSRRAHAVSGVYEPLVGDFDGSGSDDVFWYAPGPAADHVWYADDDGFRSTPRSVSGSYRPFIGDFDGSGSDDVFWYAPGSAPDHVWYSARGSFRSERVSVSGTYDPLVGDFDGSGSDDVFWYAAGSAPDHLWRGSATGFSSSPRPVSGTYLPLTGDFDADGRDDVFWYAAGPTGDFVWYGGPSFSSRPARVDGTYRPIVAAFDGRGDDILWYAPGATSDHLWTGSGRGFTSRPQTVAGTYQPVGERRPSFASRREAVGPGTAHPLRHSYRAGCPVGAADLVAIRFPHWDFAGGSVTGVVIVHRSVANDVEQALHRLHDLGFPLRRAVPVDAYGGDDDRSMAADNTSAFNCRTVAGTSTLSQHAYGWALDLNPVENPFVRGSTVEPPAGAEYTDRSGRRPGMVLAGDPVVSVFAGIGWEWGGDWSSAKDYQHFSLTGR